VSSFASRWGPVITRAVGWLLIIAWLALLGWWIYTVYISEIITWIILTLIGWRLRPLARRLWWRYGWHWPLPPAPPPSPHPPFRICCGHDYRGWVSAPRQIAVLVLGPPRSGKTRGLIIPNVIAWEGPALATTTRRDVPDATCARRAQMGTAWLFDPLGVAAAAQGRGGRHPLGHLGHPALRRPPPRRRPGRPLHGDRLRLGPRPARRARPSRPSVSSRSTSS